MVRCKRCNVMWDRSVVYPDCWFCGRDDCLTSVLTPQVGEGAAA